MEYISMQMQYVVNIWDKSNLLDDCAEHYHGKNRYKNNPQSI